MLCGFARNLTRFNPFAPSLQPPKLEEFGQQWPTYETYSLSLESQIAHSTCTNRRLILALRWACKSGEGR